MMIRRLIGAAIAALGLARGVTAGEEGSNVMQKPKTEVPKSFYDFHVKDIDGADVSLAKYKGAVCLVVNVASK
jgi:cytochrome oxidase Cu insertion factor (SCO1/SenC/PrrC family)